MFELKSQNDRNCQISLAIEIFPKLFQVSSSLVFSSSIPENIYRFPRIISFVSFHQVVVQLYNLNTIEHKKVNYFLASLLAVLG